MISVARLKNWEAPWMCEVGGEMLKAGSEVVVDWLHRIVSRAWTCLVSRACMDW